MATAILQTPSRTEPAPYDGFDKILVNGQWRSGRGKVSEDRDPYTDEVLVRIPVADEQVVDEAYRAAAAAQGTWAGSPPSERSAVLRRPPRSWRPGATRSSIGSSASPAARASRRTSSGNSPWP